MKKHVVKCLWLDAASTMVQFGLRPLQVPVIGVTIRPLAAFELAVSVFVAVLWLRSGLAHLGNQYYFLSSIYKYEIVGTTVGRYMAIILPYIQLVVASCLLGRLFVRGSLFLSGILLMTFAIAQLSATARGLKINCGCFGAAFDTTIGSFSLATTCLLSIAAITAWICSRWMDNPLISQK